jgi:hypothetical protein
MGTSRPLPLLLCITLSGCSNEVPPFEDCVAPLSHYCVGADQLQADCPELAMPSNVVPCGPYEVTPTRAGTSTSRHYFLDGEHVATMWGSDEQEYCSGRSYTQWFGEVLHCTPEEDVDTGAYTYGY